ncbi:MAG: hypothetical protein M1812_004893 [Candelaria pacifica]|nr:MAG: hypothetical protein M1812_004893 [Candelaria pacifica]
MDALIDWVVAHGGALHDGVRIATDPSMGTLLKAHGPLESKTTVVTCPHSLTMSYLNAKAISGFSPHGPVFPASFLDVLPPRTVTVFFLSQQYLLGEESFWSPYIKTLPQPGVGDKLSTPFYFSDEDRLWLRGTNMEKGYMEREIEWKDLWTKGISILMEEAWDTAGYTWPLALWAATILSSRSFISSLLVSALPADVKETSMAKENSFPVLYPLADTVNHRPEAKISWHTGPEELGLVIEDSLAPGDIIWNNYGQKSNEELLLGYGFCVPDNPFDQFGLKIRVPQESSSNNDTTTEQSSNPGATLLNSTTTALSDVIFYIRSSTHPSKGYDHPLKELRCFPPYLLNIMSALVANDLERKSIPNPQTQEPYTRNQYAIISQLLTVLLRKHTEIKSHTPLLPSQPQTRNQANAKIYRESQLSILTSVIHLLKTALKKATTALNYTSTPNLLTLETALKLLSEIDRKQYKAFNRGLEISLGTSQIPELREAGWEQSIWILWICVLKILSSRKEKETKLSKQSTGNLMVWICSMESRYPFSSVPTSMPASHEDENDDDEEALSQLLNLIQSASKDLSPEGPESKSIFKDKSWDINLLRWGNTVAKEEGFAIILLDDDDDDDGDEKVFLDQHIMYINSNSS